MDSARSTIVARVAELGLSLSELSLKVGKNHAYFQQFIKRGVPNRLPEEVRGRVAEILGLDELALRQPTATHLRFMLSGEPQVPIRGATGWIPVYGVGDTMEPRYFAGETVFVNPRLPISRGSFVVAQISKGEEPEPRAYVKRFLSQDGKRLRLEQYNPKKILEFPTSTVVAIHRIVMSSESR